MPVEQPKFWIVAGVNGAGKTTFARRPDIRRFVGAYRYFNPDEVASKLKETNPGQADGDYDLQAVVAVEQNVDQCIILGESFLVETVLSTEKYLRRVEAAKAAGFFVGMVYVGLPSVDLALKRISERVADRGHNVEEARVRRRWGRSHEMLARFVPLLDVLFVYANITETNPTLVARKRNGELQLIEPGLLPDVERALQALLA